MPRGPRLDAPGLVHHVMIRGVAGCALFLDDIDREDLLLRFDRWVVGLGFACLAWVLMTNHAHFILRTGSVPLSVLMAKIETGFALRFNRRHGRAGHLVQNRYRSKLIQDDAYLCTATAYVFRNPREAGLCTAENQRDFPWCGLGAVVGARMPRPFESIAATLAAFGGDVSALLAAIERGEPIVDPWQWRGFEPERRARRRARGAGGFAGLLEDAAAARHLTAAAILGGSRLRSISEARRVIARRAAFELGIRSSEIARRLGVSPQAVSRMLDS